MDDRRTVSTFVSADDGSIVLSLHLSHDHRPATTPKTLRGRFAFAFTVAALDAFIRMKFIPFSNIYALTIVSLARPLLADGSLAGLASQTRLIWSSRIAFAIPVICSLIAYRSYSEGKIYSEDAPYKITQASTAPHEGELFRQKQKELGLQFKAVDPDVDAKLANKLRIQWVGPGVTVRDFNGDGWMDILLINSNHGKSKNALFINQNGKGFVDEAAKWGIDKIPEDLIPQAATPFDFDRDGKIDLLLTGPGCTHLYKNEGSRFEDVSEAAGLRDCSNSIVALPLDFDGDGWMDIYLARFFPKQIDLKNVKDLFYFGPDNFSRAKNGGIDTLLRNVNGRFVPAPEVYNPSVGGWTWDVGVADIRNDGKLVLVVGNDFGADHYLEIGKEKFRDITDDITFRDDRSSMNVSFGEWQGPCRKSSSPMCMCPNIACAETSSGNSIPLTQNSSITKRIGKRITAPGPGVPPLRILILMAKPISTWQMG